MQCPDCGAFATADDLFCGECGRPLVAEVPADAPAATPAKAPAAALPRPEDVKDEVTVMLEPSRPSPRPPQAKPAEKKASLKPVFILAGVILLMICGLGAGIVFWVASEVRIVEVEPTSFPTFLPAVVEPTPAPLDIVTVVAPTLPPQKGIPDTGSLLYADDFDSGSGWDVYQDDDTWADYVDGEYALGVNRADFVTWGNPDIEQEFTDFVLEVDARQVEGPLDNNFGPLVRYQDGDSFYWFQISGDGYYSVDVMWDGEWADLVTWQFSEAINQGLGATNHILVMCDGVEFSFYVNDVYLASVLHSAFESGNIGLAAGTFDEAGVVIHFDDLAVRALTE